MANTVVSAERYEDLIRRSGLVEKDQLDAVLKAIVQAGGKAADSNVLAKQLIEKKLITNWQNEKLMQGRHRGFFLGKYKLLTHIAKGGMSEVYVAEQVMLRRRVAIKIFPPELIEKSSYLARFYQESQTQAAMDHPNIIKALDFGNEGKIHYLVMEYVDGLNLNQFVERKGPLPFRLAAKFIAQAAEALDYAHKEGMVHRDVKPANLMLDRTGTIKLLDLGLARVLDGEQGSLTLKHNENTLGTADYVAPEQAVDSHNIDERADIYSLGGTLYFLLTGHPPFPEGTPVQRMMMHMNQDPESILKSRADTPRELVAICEKMMRKRPDDRFQSAEQVAKLLQKWLEKSKRGKASQAENAASAPVREAEATPVASDDETVSTPAEVTEKVRTPQVEPETGAPIINVEETSPAQTYTARQTNVARLVGEVIYGAVVGVTAGGIFGGATGMIEMGLAYGVVTGLVFGAGRAIFEHVAAPKR